MASYEKAYLDICEPATTSGGGTGSNNQRRPGSSIRLLKFQFNPEKLSIKKEAEWKPASQEGAEATPFPQYKSPKPVNLSLDMLLDAAHSPSNDIVGDIDALLGCLVPTTRSRSQGTPHPPLVKFGWGTKLTLTAYVTSVSTEYQLFQPNGTPIRAKCTVALSEYPSTTQRQNPTSGGTATHTTRTLRAGDTLASVAYDEYGNASLWRGLARANDLEDPLRAPVGLSLLVPPSDEVEALS